MPVDVSESALVGAAHRVLAELPGTDRERGGLGLRGPAGPARRPTGPRLVAFLGSTIGNLLPPERAAFLARLRAGLRHGDALLLGTDLVKDAAVLLDAYDDAAGVTAAFNKNVLSVLNAELGADFDPDAFDHMAVWDPQAEWIEMRLRSAEDQVVQVPGIGLTVTVRGGRAAADRGVGQVPAGRGGGRAGRRGVRDGVLVDRPGRPVRPVPVGSGRRSGEIALKRNWGRSRGRGRARYGSRQEPWPARGIRIRGGRHHHGETSSGGPP